MGAVLKNVIPQMAEASGATPTLPIFLNESLARIPTINAAEIRRLSGFIPVIVLIHKSTIRNATGPEELSLADMSKSNRLLELCGQAMRPFGTADADRTFSFGEVTVTMESMETCRNGVPVELTAMEFKILRHFVLNARRVISRDELLNQVWGYENYPCTRTVDNHILRLRQKLERDPSRPAHFRTVHGAGYKFLP